MSDDRLIRAEKLVVKYATGWDSLPSGWTQESFKKFWNTLTEESEHPWTKCVEKMTGNIDDPEAFCASAKDTAMGTTSWRGEKQAQWGDPGDWYLDEVDDFVDDSNNLLTAEDDMDSEKEAFTPSRRHGPTHKMDPREKRQQQMRRNRQPKSEKQKEYKHERKLEQRRPGMAPSQRSASDESMLRKAVIRLAHAKPELRAELMPLLKEASYYGDALLKREDIEKVLRKSGVDYSVNRSGDFVIGDLLIYWDDQDPENEGWAFRTRYESGEVDSLRDVENLLRSAWR